MKIKLIQYDGHIPNLALMKLSSYHKRKGDIVGFDIEEPDKIYISSIFTWNRRKLLDDIERLKKTAEVEYGGSGINLKKELPYEIEHIIPDYELYGINYSIGFTSRGCIRKCKFCIVPVKEGYIHEHSTFDEFVHPDHKHILLLDNNFLASPKVIEKIEYLIENKYRVSINQGLDIRLINEENAKLLRELKSRDLRFKNRRYYFAWDSIEYSNKVFSGLDILSTVGIPMHKCMFYVLVGFDSSFEFDLYRIHKLLEYNVLPFVMKFNNKQEAKINALAKWINRRYYRVVPWESFKGNKWKDEFDIDVIMKKYDKILEGG